MSIIHATEFVLSLPDSLKDRSINIFSLTDDGPSDFSVVVSRERPQPGETLERFSERALTAMLSRLPLFHVEKREILRVDGQPAIQLDYTWQSKDGKVFQRQVLVHVPRLNVVLLITATCRDKLGSRWESTFAELLAGFRLRPA